MQSVHWATGTWVKAVDAYVALTGFARRKFIEGGLPPAKIMVKPNFVDPDPGAGGGDGGYFLFVGRLSREKGVETLLAAWEQLRGRTPIKIVGDGPLAPEVAAAARRIPELEWVGRQPRDRVLAMMKNAKALIFPSVWYEGFPMVMVEAYAVGLPVIATDLGSMSSLVDHGRTGLRFRPSDPQELANQAKWALAHPTELGQMREEARSEFEGNYTAERNYRLLTKIYQTVVERVRARA
jgi:glycosyltransferase involved in cell wall biosynthesis